VQQADEIVMVDLTPGALVHRIQRGVVYDREKAERALQNFFRESTLVALRELALRQAAHEVEHRIENEEATTNNEERDGARTERQHKILVLVLPDPETAMLIRRAKRVGDFLGAECFAVAVEPTGDLGNLPEADREAIQQHLNFARNLRIETRILEGEDVARTLVEFARRNQVTQIFLARPRGWRWFQRLSLNLVQRIVRMARDMQVVIVSPREPVMHEGTDHVTQPDRG
jgi:two-component system sensor histidine kinase KdpD